MNPINPRALYSSKAEHYARYRWDYPAEAVQAIVDTAGITAASTVADVGAGTGMLTKHLAPLVARIYAVEPNGEMRAQTEQVLSASASCIVCDASAEATGLPDASIDLITVAQAIHWFNPGPTRCELARILRPCGWLAILHNTPLADELSTATSRLMTPEFGVKATSEAQPWAPVPATFYFGTGPLQQQHFLFSFESDWQGYLGALLSASSTPSPTDPQFDAFVTAARELYELHYPDGRHTVRGQTELWIGQPQ